ncbi:MAG: 50S ribosomal protein L32 [Candidatus Omnitrophica bacterium]|nr:50S ribosomal protein L32 [Candidatus Omnitrophota bacterium]
MANPKRRHSNTRTQTRRAHDFIKLKSVSKCSNCSAPVLPHRVCMACGFYKGRQVLTIKIKEKKKS